MAATLNHPASISPPACQTPPAVPRPALGHARWRLWLRFTLLSIAWLAASLSAHAAPSFTARLDRDTISLGETATLSLVFEGGAPASAPAILPQPGLQIHYMGQSSQITIFNGRSSSTLTHDYQIVPGQPGEFVIPAIRATVENRTLASPPLTLKVLKPDQSNPSNQPKLAFLRLVVPKNTVYVGEVFPVEIQVFVTGGEGLQVQPLQSEGFLMGKMPQGIKGLTQIQGIRYNVISYKLTASAVRSGTIPLGPAQCNLVVYVPQNNNRRPRDPLDAFPDAFDLFGPRIQKQPMTLVSDPQIMEVLPLPAQDQPPAFNGAIGNFSLAAAAGPTNVNVADPITLRVAISGQGALETLPFPLQTHWKGFKLYPPTSVITADDSLGVSGTKTFEQVLIPLHSEIKEIPELTFTFFDPAQAAYRTLQHPSIPITVAPNANPQAQPTVLAGPSQTVPSLAQTFAHIKPHLGAIAPPASALISKTSFWLLQLLPAALCLAAFAWRKRNDLFQRNPALQRRRRVAESVRAGLKELARYAEEKKPEQFFATIFRLLQDKLGERLNLPAFAITEAILDERLRSRGVSERSLDELHSLFHLCNQARYAPQQSREELTSLIPKVQTALLDLDAVPLENDPPATPASSRPGIR